MDDYLKWAGLELSGGRYHVRQKLGEGGMGYVYRAWDRHLDAEVVIKVPRRSMLEDPESAQRFAREIRSLVRLVHPNIVGVTDVGEHDGLPFAVMRYLSGGSLARRIGTEEGGAAPVIDPGEAVGWLEGVAAALDFIHAQGFIHRDVKPDNILFDSHGNVFLGDFGVAKALAAEVGRTAALTGTGMALGTPEYMAPELIEGRPCDGRVDQYALAATLHEVLTGQSLFAGPSHAAIWVQHLTKPPPRIDHLRPAISRPVADAVTRALAKDPAQRYPNCATFVAAVRAATRQAPSGAPVGNAATLPPPLPAAATEPVRIECPQCGKGYKVPQEFLGKKIRCPSCQAVFPTAPQTRPPTGTPGPARATPGPIGPAHPTPWPFLPNSAAKGLEARPAGASPRDEAGGRAAREVAAGRPGQDEPAAEVGYSSEFAVLGVFLLVGLAAVAAILDALFLDGVVAPRFWFPLAITTVALLMLVLQLMLEPRRAVAALLLAGGLSVLVDGSAYLAGMPPPITALYHLPGEMLGYRSVLDALALDFVPSWVALPVLLTVPAIPLLVLNLGRSRVALRAYVLLVVWTMGMYVVWRPTDFDQATTSRLIALALGIATRWMTVAAGVLALRLRVVRATVGRPFPHPGPWLARRRAAARAATRPAMASSPWWGGGRARWKILVLQDEIARMQYVQQALLGGVGREALTRPESAPGFDMAALRAAHADVSGRSRALEQQIRDLAAVPGTKGVIREWQDGLHPLRDRAMELERQAGQMLWDARANLPGLSASWPKLEGLAQAIGHAEERLAALRAAHPAPDDDPGPVDAAADLVRRAHVDHEALIRRFGLLFHGFAVLLIVDAAIAGGSLAGPAVVAVFLAALGEGLRRLHTRARWTGAALAAIALAISALALVGFLAGLVRVAREGDLAGHLLSSTFLRSELPSLVVTGLALVFFGSTIYLVLSPRGAMVFSVRYRAAIARTPRVWVRLRPRARLALIIGVSVYLAVHLLRWAGGSGDVGPPRAVGLEVDRLTPGPPDVGRGRVRGGPIGKSWRGAR